MKLIEIKNIAESRDEPFYQRNLKNYNDLKIELNDMGISVGDVRSDDTVVCNIPRKYIKDRKLLSLKSQDIIKKLDFENIINDYGWYVLYINGTHKYGTGGLDVVIHPIFSKHHGIKESAPIVDIDQIEQKRIRQLTDLKIELEDHGFECDDVSPIPKHDPAQINSTGTAYKLTVYITEQYRLGHDIDVRYSDVAVEESGIMDIIRNYNCRIYNFQMLMNNAVCIIIYTDFF